jgi:4-carboxymuconolactone decarboxylase
MITVAILTALGKQHELKGHVRGALNNGVAPQELQELLLHAAVYCGIPTAVDAFRTAAEVVDGQAAR